MIEGSIQANGEEVVHEQTRYAMLRSACAGSCVSKWRFRTTRGAGLRAAFSWADFAMVLRASDVDLTRLHAC